MSEWAGGMGRAMRALGWFWIGTVIMGCGQIKQAAAPDAAGDPQVDASPDGQGCVPSPVGLQARWRGETNARDETGAHDGVAISGQFTAGRHGAAFVFNGADSVVSADPQDALWPPGSFSVELWVKGSAASTPYSEIIAKYGCGGADGCDGSDYDFLVGVRDVDHAQQRFYVDGTLSALCILE